MMRVGNLMFASSVFMIFSVHWLVDGFTIHWIHGPQQPRYTTSCCSPPRQNAKERLLCPGFKKIVTKATKRRKTPPGRYMSTSSLFVVEGEDNREDSSLDLKDENECRNVVLPREESASSMMGAWVPVGSISCLEGLDPLQMEIMGCSFVVWKGKVGNKGGSSTGSSSSWSWSVLKDECPHRMAPLSQGRVDPISKCIECAYHGWQFDTNGTLVRIPHLDTASSSPTSMSTSSSRLQPESRSVESFPTHVTGDLLWVFLPTLFHGESFPRNLLPEDYYYGLNAFVNKGASYYTQEMPFSFDFFVENVLDGPAHAYFAHHAFGFRREEVRPLPIKVSTSNFTELMTEVTYLRQGAERRRRYGYQRPFMLMNQQPAQSGEGWTTAIAFFAVPIRDGYTRLITTFDTLRPHPATPDWMLHIINQKFLEGDCIVHNSEIAIRREPSVAPKYIYATSSDTGVKAWRSWWTKYGLSAAPPHTFGPALSHNLKLLDRKELSNTWRYHTRHCSKCRTALRRLRMAQRFGTVVAWAAPLTFYLKRNSSSTVLLSYAAAGLLGAITTLVAKRLIRELEGPSSGSEVSDRSLSASL